MVAEDISGDIDDLAIGCFGGVAAGWGWENDLILKI
jgi:hypothetical protein